MTTKTPAGDETPAEQSGTASEYTFDGTKKPPGVPVASDDVQQVYEAVLESTGGDGWARSDKLDVGDMSNSEIGGALSALAADEDCPLNLAQWYDNSSSQSTLWRVTREPEPDADGGRDTSSSTQECPQCGTLVDRFVNRERCWRCHAAVFESTRGVAADGGRSEVSIADEECRFSEQEFVLLMDWYMVSDPWPLPDRGNELVEQMLNDEAERWGFESWIMAYHELGGRDE